MNLLKPVRVQCIIASLALMLATAVAAVAQPLEVPRGQALSVKLDAPANTVAVGDEEIADARVAFGDTIVLMGKEPGVTNLIVFDQQGAEIFSSMVSVVAARDSRPVTIIAGMTRRTLTCGPRRCTEERVPDQIIESRTTFEGGTLADQSTIERTISR